MSAVVFYLLGLLAVAAICADSKRRETYSLTPAGEEAAARAIAQPVRQVVYGARAGVYVRATRHPSGHVVIETIDADAMADELARGVEA